MDVVIENLDGSPEVLRNPGVPGRHWVSFELAGTKTNRLAIGARLKVVAGGVTQTEEIHSGGSYLSQNDLRVHFGLGSAEKIDLLEIRWPSGTTETVKNLAADRFYSVEEGKGVVPPAQIRAAAGRNHPFDTSVAGSPFIPEASKHSAAPPAMPASSPYWAGTMGISTQRGLTEQRGSRR